MTKIENNTLKFVLLFYGSKLEKKASTKDDQATGEAYSPQKRTSSTSKDEIYQLFSIFLGHFGPLGSG
jgi:hypothetical protein